MKKQTAAQTEKTNVLRKGAKPSKLNTMLMALEVGESIIFKRTEWPMQSGIPQYLLYFKRLGRRYSVSTTADGKKKVIVRKA